MVSRTRRQDHLHRGCAAGREGHLPIPHRKPSYEFASVLEILTSSSSRTEPKCPHYNMCGGCALQHMDATAQVAAKQHLLESSLWHIGKVKPESMLEPIDGPPWGYRHKARLRVKICRKETTCAGGIQRKSHTFCGGYE